MVVVAVAADWIPSHRFVRQLNASRAIFDRFDFLGKPPRND
jgi:hypothetical protein